LAITYPDQARAPDGEKGEGGIKKTSGTEAYSPCQMIVQTDLCGANKDKKGGREHTEDRKATGNGQIKKRSSNTTKGFKPARGSKKEGKKAKPE